MRRPEQDAVLWEDFGEKFRGQHYGILFKSIATMYVY